MLTDVSLEEEFGRSGEEEDEEEEDDDDEGRWYRRKDLERDLHLAAELGKTLLERNQELEAGLQQMYSTNQEQLLEIEHLSRQVELQRQVNEQQVKVYEQLDASSREQERSNHTLLLQNRSAQQRIRGLTESVDALQVQMEELQKQVEELKVRAEVTEGQEQLQQRRVSEERPRPDLQLHLHTLRTQLAAERSRRAEAEQEAELTLQENALLERRLDFLEGAGRRQAELEAELEELRELWRCDPARPADALLPDAVFFPAEEGAEPEEEEEGRSRRRCTSDSCVYGTRLQQERTCVGPARGVSLLTEVDAQYSALQLKYEQLLSRCSHTHEGRGQPEYKALFQEIFTCIQKTKEDLSENRAGHGQEATPHSPT